MRILRRPPRPAPPATGAVLTGVVPLDEPVSGQTISTDRTPSDGGIPGARCDLEAVDEGLIVSPVDGAHRGVPALVPWSDVTSLRADDVAEPRTGLSGQVLEVELDDNALLGGGSTHRFIVPASDVGAFLLAASSVRHMTAKADSSAPDRAIGAASGLRGAAALRSLTSVWPGDRPLGSGDPQHGLGRRRLGPIAVGLLALILLTGSTATTLGSRASGASGPPSSHFADQGNEFQASQMHPVAKLPAATSAPAPAPPSLAGSPPLQSHEIFGYAPYWTLPQSSGFDVQDLTTLAYFSVDANADGTLDQSGSGWNGYESQDLVNLVTRSHAAGDRVVLTVTDFSQSSLNAITSDPNAGARFSAALISAISAKNLDGVNFDFEGEGSADQAGLTALITQVSNALHAANPHWQVTMAVYASAAADSGGFYNIAALAPAVDGFFVMAYDMNSKTTPSATSPLVGGGYNDTEALQQFTAVVPAAKVILGVPFYGYDWPTSDGTNTAQAAGSESPLSDGVIAASGHPTYWDPTTQTAWTSYQVGSQWHETYFDNPTSLALKAQLANFFQIAGVGIWALGMDGNNPAMLTALLGNAPAAKDYQTGPTTTTTSASSTTTPAGPPGTGYVTTGVWEGTAVSLSPLDTPASEGSAQYLGTLSQLSTTDPDLTCLQSGSPLGVWSYSALPGVDVVVAAQPDDCASALWTFVPPPTIGGSPPTTTTTSVPTTTTTVLPTTTTTTSTTATTTTTTTTTTP